MKIPRPSVGGVYWYIDTRTNISRVTRWFNTVEDEHRYSQGNVHRARQSAERWWTEFRLESNSNGRDRLRGTNWTRAFVM